MNQKETLAGGYSEYRTEITEEEMRIFAAATEGLLGVSYDPFAVATQVVSGMNYDFLCNAKVVAPGTPNYGASIEIYAPLQGQAHITDISRIPR